MYGTNPYAQAGWYDPGNPYSINEKGGPTVPSQAPTFGALPYPGGPTPSTKRFVFTSQRQGLVHRCDVFDNDTRLKAYTINMAQKVYDYTSLKRPDGAPVGYVVWKPEGPEVEVYGSFGMQKAKDWLPLSPDKSSRLMQFQGRHYTWQFARDAMYLYAYVLNKHQQIGKVYPAKDGTTIFEASELVVSSGMVDSLILAIALLLSENFRD